MIQYEKTVEPDAALSARYAEIYPGFLEDLKRNTAYRG